MLASSGARQLIAFALSGFLATYFLLLVVQFVMSGKEKHEETLFASTGAANGELFKSKIVE